MVQEFSRLLGVFFVFADEAHSLGASRKGKMAGKLLILHPLASMRLRISLQLKAGRVPGRIFRESTMRKSINSISFIAYMGRARMLLPKLSWEHGSMIL